MQNPIKKAGLRKETGLFFEAYCVNQYGCSAV